MEPTLDFHDSLVLEIRFSGAVEACLSPGRKLATQSTEQGTAPASGQVRQSTRRSRAVSSPSRRSARAKTAAPSEPETTVVPEVSPVSVTPETPAETAPAQPVSETPVETVPAQSEPTAEEASTTTEAGSDTSDLPEEVIRLPKKHQDFYVRKYGEYLEVYPAEKARELALQAVRSIASPPR